MANTGKVIFKDEIEAIQEEAKSLKARGIDIIIALGHSGLEKDIEIAEKVPQISLIVGGHSHILMHTPKGNFAFEKFSRFAYRSTIDKGVLIIYLF